MRRILPILIILVVSATGAHAALTTASCLAAKQKTWGTLRKCEAGQKAKLLLSKPADLAKCHTKSADKLGKISAKAAAASVPCRYGDNGDGTVTDYDTGLQWEQKTDLDDTVNSENAHDADNLYSWNTVSLGTAPNGTAFTEFLGALNNCSAITNLFPDSIDGGFAGHCDWRLPSVYELMSIVDPGCPLSGACIDPIFGPTVIGVYWSGTTAGSDAGKAWYWDTGSRDSLFVGSPTRDGLGASVPFALPSDLTARWISTTVRAVRGNL